jgi:hypothetical protein
VRSHRLHSAVFILFPPTGSLALSIPGKSLGFTTLPKKRDLHLSACYFRHLPDRLSFLHVHSV